MASVMFNSYICVSYTKHQDQEESHPKFSTQLLLQAIESVLHSVSSYQAFVTPELEHYSNEDAEEGKSGHT